DDMHPLFCLFKFKLRPFINDFLLMIYIACQNLFQSEQFRRPIADCDHIEVIRDLQVRTLVQVVDDAFDVRIFTDFNRYSQALPVGFIPDFQNTVDFSIRTDFINLFDQICLINFEWQLGHCNQFFTAAEIFSFDLRTDDDSAASGFISFFQFILPLNDAAGRKIRTFHNLKQLINFDSGFIDDLQCRIDDLTKVMGGISVAYPAEIPVDPLTRILGKRDGITVGSTSVSSKLFIKSTVFLLMSLSISLESSASFASV